MNGDPVTLWGFVVVVIFLAVVWKLPGHLLWTEFCGPTEIHLLKPSSSLGWYLEEVVLWELLQSRGLSPGLMGLVPLDEETAERVISLPPSPRHPSLPPSLR